MKSEVMEALDALNKASSWLAAQSYVGAQSIAMLQISAELLQHGAAKSLELSVAISEGLVRGLAKETNHRYPKCPFCGQRHP